MGTRSKSKYGISTFDTKIEMDVHIVTDGKKGKYCSIMCPFTSILPEGRQLTKRCYLFNEPLVPKGKKSFNPCRKNKKSDVFKTCRQCRDLTRSLDCGD